MAEISADVRHKLTSVKPLVPELLLERGISDHSKVGNFVPVALGLRTVALTYLPAELPGGTRLGVAIDQYFADNYTPSQSGGGGLGFLRRGGKQRGGPDPEAELRAKRKTLDDAYDAIVAASPAYIAHLAWLDRLDLSQMHVKRRPSLREMYIYHDRQVRERLKELEEMADKAREKAVAQPGKDPRQAVIGYVYANEFDPHYLRGLGALLGYPECCIEEYTADRMKGQNVEQRAWEQVRRMQEQGESIDVRAYYVKDFFPCRPDCPQARAQGELYEGIYEELHPELSELYTGMLWNAFELIQNYPVLIDQHRQRLEQGPIQ